MFGHRLDSISETFSSQNDAVIPPLPSYLPSLCGPSSPIPPLAVKTQIHPHGTSVCTVYWTNGWVTLPSLSSKAFAKHFSPPCRCDRQEQGGAEEQGRPLDLHTHLAKYAGRHVHQYKDQRAGLTNPTLTWVACN